MPRGKTKNTKKDDMSDVTADQLFSMTGTGRTINAVKELYNHATRKKPGEKGYKPANPNKPMGEKKKKRKPKKTYHYEYK